MARRITWRTFAFDRNPPADPDAFKNAISKADKDGRIYDPRAGRRAIGVCIDRPTAYITL